MSKTGGGPGTNQYQVRGSAISSVPVPSGPTMVEIEANTHQDMTVFTTAMVTALQRSREVDAREIILELPDCPAHIIRQIALDKNAGVEHLAQAIIHPNCPVDVVEFAKQQKPRSFEVKLALVHLQGAPAKVWRSLAYGKSDSNKVRVALTPGCPTEIKEKIWAELSRTGDGGSWFRVGYKESGRRCADVFVQSIEITSDMHVWTQGVSQSYNHDIVEALASNPTCPTEILIALLGRPDASIREAVLANPNTPAHIRAIAVLGQ